MASAPDSYIRIPELRNLKMPWMFSKPDSILNQAANTTAEERETLILSLPTLPADVNLLNDHRQFEIGKNHVEVQRREVATAFLCIDLHKPLATDEPWQDRDGWQH